MSPRTSACPPASGASSVAATIASANPTLRCGSAITSSTTPITPAVGSTSERATTWSDFRARATGHAPGGMTVRDWATFHSLDPVRMATDAEMTRGMTALGENVTALVKAPKGEDYSGPVLFEGVAGAQVFAEVLGKNLAL